MLRRLVIGFILFWGMGVVSSLAQSNGHGAVAMCYDVVFYKDQACVTGLTTQAYGTVNQWYLYKFPGGELVSCGSNAVTNKTEPYAEWSVPLGALPNGSYLFDIVSHYYPNGTYVDGVVFDMEYFP